MLIRRFEGDTTAEALAKVRAAFGEEALVLGTKKLRKGRSWLGAGARPVYEVTAAIDRDHAPGPHKGHARQGVDVHPSWKPLQLSRAVVEPLEDEMRSLRAAVEELREREHSDRSLTREIEELRRLARQLASSRPSSGMAHDAYRAAGLPDALSEELTSVVEHRALVGERREIALVECLAERVDERLIVPRDDDPSPRMIVGTAGVGKTTTLAKIAARNAHLRTQLVTTDVHRYGGVEALRGLASQLDLEVSVARTPEELADIVRSHRGGIRGGAKSDRILVDTAGRSIRDGSAIDDLLAMRRALGETAKVDLVLAATTKPTDLAHQLRHFAPLEASSIVLSKADESSELGSAVHALLDPACPPLGFVANGQRVPDDLEVPDPYEFAQRVMGAI